MRFHPVIFQALDGPTNGEAARAAERRAMYARPDATPLPPEPPRMSAFARFLARLPRQTSAIGKIGKTGQVRPAGDKSAGPA